MQRGGGGAAASPSRKSRHCHTARYLPGHDPSHRPRGRRELPRLWRLSDRQRPAAAGRAGSTGRRRTGGPPTPTWRRSTRWSSRSSSTCAAPASGSAIPPAARPRSPARSSRTTRARGPATIPGGTSCGAATSREQAFRDYLLDYYRDRAVQAAPRRPVRALLPGAGRRRGAGADPLRGRQGPHRRAGRADPSRGRRPPGRHPRRLPAHQQSGADRRPRADGRGDDRPGDRPHADRRGHPRRHRRRGRVSRRGVPRHRSRATAGSTPTWSARSASTRRCAPRSRPRCWSSATPPAAPGRRAAAAAASSGRGCRAARPSRSGPASPG